jgi:NAD dependent epimerase/dehydratase
MTEFALVTGADGFIGSHLVEHLVSSGRPVRALVQYNSFGHIGWLQDLAPDVMKHVQVVVGDVRSPEFCNDILSGVSDAFHLAALIGIPYSYRSPRDYVATNISGMLNVLEATRKHGPRTLTVVSTSEVYGTPERVPISEAHPLKAQSPYAATKIAADQLALAFSRTYDGLDIRIARPFNSFGPRQSTRAFIPTVISQCLAGIAPLRLGSLTTTRDYTFVTDTARGIAAVGSAQDACGSVFNIGTGFSWSMGWIASTIMDIMDYSGVIEVDQGRMRPTNSEVLDLRADATAVTAKTGWIPELSGESGFRAGLEQTVRWYLKNQRQLGTDALEWRD